MNAKVTVIAVKDIGPVLGAVSEMASEDKLAVDQVVAADGFPLRNDVPVTLQAPPSELETFLASGQGPLTEPRSYVMIGGVATIVPAAFTISSVTLKPAAIEIAFTGSSTAPSVNADIKVKAVLRRHSDNVVEVLAPAPLRPVAVSPQITLGANLHSKETYDVLVAVEGYRASFTEGLLVP